MPVQCPSCKLLFSTSNELDWHTREEHMRPSLPVRTPPADDVTTRAGPDRPPPAPEPNATGRAPSGPLAWLRRWLRPSPSSRQPPR
jgi:hypothetical protein